MNKPKPATSWSAKDSNLGTEDDKPEREMKMMEYGQKLIEVLERENENMKKAMDRRFDHVSNCDFDWDDCFVSQRFDERGIRTNNDKIKLIKDGGCAWFQEYATLEGKLVDARWINTKFGYSLRVNMPDGSTVWTTANTAKGLAKKGLKKVECKRPAWYCFRSNGSGMMGAYTGEYVLFPSDINYATGEAASDEPLEIRDVEE